jgi:hypothetical protein
MLRPVAAQAPAQPVDDFRRLQADLSGIQPLPPDEDMGSLPLEEAAITTEGDTAGGQPGAAERIAQQYIDVPEVPPVEPPDAEDPTEVGRPEKGVPDQPDVEQPPAPRVGEPSESVPIQIEGGEPQN